MGGFCFSQGHVHVAVHSVSLHCSSCLFSHPCCAALCAAGKNAECNLLGLPSDLAELLATTSDTFRCPNCLAGVQQVTGVARVPLNQRWNGRCICVAGLLAALDGRGSLGLAG